MRDEREGKASRECTKQFNFSASNIFYSLLRSFRFFASTDLVHGKLGKISSNAQLREHLAGIKLKVRWRGRGDAGRFAIPLAAVAESNMIKTIQRAFD